MENPKQSQPPRSVEALGTDAILDEAIKRARIELGSDAPSEKVTARAEQLLFVAEHGLLSARSSTPPRE